MCKCFELSHQDESVMRALTTVGNFLSDHQLLHSWDFHVLCRLGNRMNCERVLHRRNWARASIDHNLGDV